MKAGALARRLILLCVVIGSLLLRNVMLVSDYYYNEAAALMNTLNDNNNTTIDSSSRPNATRPIIKVPSVQSQQKLSSKNEEQSRHVLLESRRPASIQVFVVTAAGQEKYRNRFLANQNGWHTLFPDLQVFTFDQNVTSNNTTTSSFTRPVHEIPMLDFEKNEQRNNLLLASFGRIYEMNPNADWYFLAEDDTVVVKKNLLKVVGNLAEATSTMRRNENVYMGRCVGAMPTKRFGRHMFIMGGSGILMSKNLLRQMAPGIPSCRRDLAKFQHGDTRIAACLMSMNIIPTKICALPESKGFKFTSSSPWLEATRPRASSHAVVTMHEKDPEKLQLLNEAVAELVRLKQDVTWGTLKPFLDQFDSSHNASRRS